MRVKCVMTELPDDLLRSLGTAWRGQNLPVTIGESYTVLGLTWWEGTVWVEIAENDRTVSAVPLVLFEIVDDRVPAAWRIRAIGKEHVTMWPELFYERAFHDRLSNASEELTEAFLQLKARLEAPE